MDYTNMQETVWICSYCAEKNTTEDTNEFKKFQRFVENLVCTVKGKPLVYLEYANSLHKSLQISLNTPNSNGKQAFLELDINVNDDRKISCHWYQKPTEAGIIIKFRS